MQPNVRCLGDESSDDNVAHSQVEIYTVVAAGTSGEATAAVIEAYLRRHPQLRQVAVVAHDDSGRRQYLTYVLSGDEPEPDVEDLRKIRFRSRTI